MGYSAEVQEILDRVVSGAPAPKRKRAPASERYKPAGPSRRGANLRGGPRPPRFDYQRIVDLWREGKTYPQIRAEMNCGNTTIVTALKTLRPEGYTGKPGRRLSACQRGHDMAVHRKVDKHGYGYCSECKRTRERVTQTGEEA